MHVSGVLLQACSALKARHALNNLALLQLADLLHDAGRPRDQQLVRRKQHAAPHLLLQVCLRRRHVRLRPHLDHRRRRASGDRRPAVKPRHADTEVHHVPARVLPQIVAVRQPQHAPRALPPHHLGQRRNLPALADSGAIAEEETRTGAVWQPLAGEPLDGIRNRLQLRIAERT